MDKIDFYNIYNQDKKIHNQILSKISNTIKKNNFILSEEVKIFERNFSKFCKSKYAVGVANGTDALFIALKSLNLKKNDEVILPAMTWKSTLTSVINNNLKPVLVDIEKDSSNIDIDKLKKKISKKTKAVILVHLYGNPVNINKVKKIVRKKNIKIIEDAAQAHGAYVNHPKKKVGSVGDIACFSFYPGKNLGAYGDAGCLTTNSKKYYNEFVKLRNIGAYNKKNKSDMSVAGINSRLDSIQATILNLKLKKLNNLNKKKVSIARYYNKNLINSKIKKIKYQKGSVYHQYVIKINLRSKFLAYLKKNKIPYGIHYPISINRLKIVKKFFSKEIYINAETLSKQCVSLPIDPELKINQLKKIVMVLNSY